MGEAGFLRVQRKIVKPGLLPPCKSIKRLALNYSVESFTTPGAFLAELLPSPTQAGQWCTDLLQPNNRRILFLGSPESYQRCHLPTGEQRSYALRVPTEVPQDSIARRKGLGQAPLQRDNPHTYPPKGAWLLRAGMERATSRVAESLCPA